MQTKKKASAHNRQVQGALKGRQANSIVTQPRDPGRYQAMCKRDEDLRRNFRAGLYLGLAMGLGIMALAMWLWVIPTMDVAVHQAQQAVSYGTVSA